MLMGNSPLCKILHLFIFLFLFCAIAYSQPFNESFDGYSAETWANGSLVLTDFHFANPGYDLFISYDGGGNYNSDPSFLATDGGPSDKVLYSDANSNGSSQVSFDCWNSNFKLNSFDIETYAGSYSYERFITINGYLSGSLVTSESVDLTSPGVQGSVTFNEAPWHDVNNHIGGVLSFNSHWQNVDNIEITGSNLFLIFDNIVVSTPILPVELTSFAAKVLNNSVNLTWKTATEVNNYGFGIERSQKSGVRSQNKNQRWNNIGFVKGNGNSNSVKEYSFTDETALNENYVYRLKQIDNDGKFEYSKVVEASLMEPDKFVLDQNYPNPFNPVTNFKFQVSNPGIVTLKIYDVLGNEITTLVNEEKEPGKYEINFNASSLSSGVYYYRLTSGDFTATKKFVLMK